MDYKKINTPEIAIVEEHGYYKRDNKHLFYAIYLPPTTIKTGIVFCSPIAEEKVRTVRVMVSFARALASLGTAVISFDYYGDGDSEGEFEAATFDDRIADIKGIFNFFKSKYSLKRTGLLGLRWGGTLAANLAESLSPDFLILWEPIIDTGKYLYNNLRLNIATQMLVAGKVLKNRDELAQDLESGLSVSIEGYTITSEFYSSAKRLSLTNKTLRYKGNSLIIHITRNTGKTGQDFEIVKNSLTNSRLLQIPKEFEWEKTETWQPAPPTLFFETIKYLNENGICGKDL